MTSTDTKVAVEDVMALSPLQQGLFSLAQLNSGDGGDDPYVIAMSADIFGELDPELLRTCAAQLLARHPNLRASFFRGDLSRPVQVVPTRVDTPWSTITASADEVDALDSDERLRPFDLERGPAIRFVLIEVPESHWRFVVVAHHIIIDGWSLPLFIGELMSMYSAGGDAGVLPPPPRPYRDYIGWLAARDQDASRTLWREHLGDSDGPTLLSPTLSAGELEVRPPRRTELKLDSDATAALAEAARTRGVTVNTVVQMAWATMLSAFTDRSDVVFGVTVSGRPSELTGVETMVGLFINTVPLRVRLDPSVGAGAQCVALQREAAKLRDHSYLPHAELRALGGIGEMFDTLLVYENFPPGGLVGGGEFTANGATFRPAALESLSHFPVTIAAHTVDDQLTVMVEVVDGALGPMSPNSLGRRLLNTVQLLIAKWDSPLRDISVLLDGEEPRLEIDVAPEPAETGVHTRFTEVAYTRLASRALSWSGGELTYRELDEAADQVAALLVGRGVRVEDPVAINLSRGPQYVVAMLGVLKAGAVIVPLDPAMPADRINDILAQCGATVIVDDQLMSAASEVTDKRSDGFDSVSALPGQAAYVVFTSGTTGRPKGVIGTHQALLAYAEDHAQHILRPAAARLSHPLRVAHAWSFTFDAAWQPLAALLDGHSVHIIEDDVQRDAESLVEIIARYGIDLIDTTPSMFAQLYAVGLLTTVPLGVLALGGEAIGIPAWNLIRDECARTGMTAYNCYGPTESTVEAVVAPIAEHPEPTIGRPTSATRAYVLDSWLRPAPDGVPGELYLSGRQLTRGYLGRPAETAGRFVADPFVPGERMYRTGDVVRRQPDGALQFLGRSDAQVKIRGFRVEPAEISAVLHTHPAVHHAHVAVRQRVRGGPRLIAYVAAEPAPDLAELRGMLSKRLPRYMVPQSIVVVDQMPLTSHGKIDEAALAALPVDDGPSAAPETETEAALVAVLSELLDGVEIDVTAEFLQLGLDSIVALSVVQGARRRGIPLRARLMLECATIRELAAAIDNESAIADHQDDEGSGPIPVLPNVHWLYEHGQPRRLAQTETIRLPEGITRPDLDRMLKAVVDGHEALRSRLDVDTMTLVEHEPASFLTEVLIKGDMVDAVAEHSAHAVERLDPQRGSMLSAVWLREPAGPGVLMLVAHVLALDPASWRIVLGELDASWHTIKSGRDPLPATEHTSYRRWSRLLAERAAELDTCDYWAAQLEGADPVLGTRRIQPKTDRIGDVVVTMSLTDAEVSARVLGGAQPAQNILAAAAARTIDRWREHRGQDQVPPLLALETHGRADGIISDTDTSDTVGLLTAIYPLRMDAPGAIEAMPGDGIDFGLLRYLRTDTAQRLRAYPDPQVLLNFLGRVHVGTGGELSPDRALLARVSPRPEPDLAVRHELTILATVIGDADNPVLGTQWRTLPSILSAEDVATLQSMWQDSLREVAP